MMQVGGVWMPAVGDGDHCLNNRRLAHSIGGLVG